MYYLWILHYAIVKGIYKRWKGMTEAASGLSFCCLIVFSLFVLILFIDSDLLWQIIRRRLPLGPMVKGIFILLIPIFYWLYSLKVTKQKIKRIRRVILIKRKFNRTFSLLYVSFFAVLFMLTFIISALKRTPF